MNKKISILILLGMCAPSFGAPSAKRVNRRKNSVNKVRPVAKKGIRKMVSRAEQLDSAQKKLRALLKARQKIRAMINKKSDRESLKQLQSRLALNVQNEKKFDALIRKMRKGVYNSGDNRPATVKEPVEKVIHVGQSRVKPVKTYAEFKPQWEKENDGMTPELASINAIRQSGQEAGISDAEIEKNLKEVRKEAKADRIQEKRFLKGQTQEELRETEVLLAQYAEEDKIARENAEAEQANRAFLAEEMGENLQEQIRAMQEYGNKSSALQQAPTPSQEARDAAATQELIQQMQKEDLERRQKESLAKQSDAEVRANQAEIAKIIREQEEEDRAARQRS